MKNKKTLKQKVALGLCCADLALAASFFGFTFTGYGIQLNARQKFVQSEEFTHAIATQLEEINAKYGDKEDTLETLQAQNNDMNYIFSLENQEKLLDASKSEYGKQYDKGMELVDIGYSCGIATMGTLLVTAFATAGKETSKKKPLQDSLGDWTIEK